MPLNVCRAMSSFCRSAALCRTKVYKRASARRGKAATRWDGTGRATGRNGTQRDGTADDATRRDDEGFQRALCAPRIEWKQRRTVQFGFHHGRLVFNYLITSTPDLRLSECPAVANNTRLVSIARFSARAFHSISRAPRRGQSRSRSIAGFSWFRYTTKRSTSTFFRTKTLGNKFDKFERYEISESWTASSRDIYLGTSLHVCRDSVGDESDSFQYS